MSRVYLGLGSNLGDRLERISSAAKQLNTVPGIQVRQMAPIIETEPVGGPAGQDPYLNTALEIETDLPPRALLEHCQAIEQQLGRTPSEQRWAARAIDIDVLLYAERVVQEPRLTIPHPRLHERWFVLEPLAELAPDVIHPVLHRSVADLLAAVTPAPAKKRAEA